MTVPATIADDLLRELNSLNDVDVNPFQINGLLKKADKLLEANAFAAYVVKGILYSYIWDVKKVREFFAKAELISPMNPFFLKNQAVALARISFDSEARESYLKALKVSRNSEVVFYEYLVFCLTTNRPDLADSALDIFNKAGGEITPRIAEKIDSNRQALKRFELAEVNLDFAERMHFIVGDVIRSYKVRDRNVSHVFVTEDGLIYLSVHVSIEANVDLVVEINEHLTDVVLNNFDYDESDKLIYQFVPVTGDPAMDRGIAQLAVQGV